MRLSSESLFFLGNYMHLLDSDIKQTSPTIVKVDSEYLFYLHNYDNRVSLKKGRPYVGLAVLINSKMYVIPLTSQTTAERRNKGLKKRNSLTTTFITASGEEISNLLHNNKNPPCRSRQRRSLGNHNRRKRGEITNAPTQ